MKTNKLLMKEIKKVAKKASKTNLQHRREMIADALPEVRKLVAKYDLAAVQHAVKILYDNRKAERELAQAEAKVQALKNKLA